MESCIFCSIVSNAVPSHKVYEDDETCAFLDIFGAPDGHTMVIPKRHGVTILDYSVDELSTLWETVQKTAEGMQKAFDTEILSIGINHGEPLGVKHLHVHIMPRFDGDGGAIIQSLPGRPLKNKDFTSVAANIRHFIQK